MSWQPIWADWAAYTAQVTTQQLPSWCTGMSRRQQGEIAFWVTQGEFAAAGTGCVKASADGRIAATKQDNGNAVIAMGPDGENKTFHAIFNGGLSGGVGGTVDDL